MANILQVTDPSPNTDNRVLGNQEARNHLSGQWIYNPVDPARVVRTDGQEEGKTDTVTGEGKYSIVDYKSNYGASTQRLEDGVELPRLLEQLLFGGRTDVLFTGQEEVGALVEQLLSSIQVDSPEAPRESLMEQWTQQTRFSGPFSMGLWNLLTQGASDGPKDAAMAFVKGFNDYLSECHLSQQMHSLIRSISQLMLENYKTDFRQLMDEMDWEVENGDTAVNTAVLNGRLIPLLSSYTSRTHDHGAVREVVILFILHAVRYENGQEDRLVQLFEWMVESRELERLFAGDVRDGFVSVFEDLDQRPGSFADVFPALVPKGTNDQAGIESTQPFYNTLNNMFLNGSVCLPLSYTLALFCCRRKDVMSEIWVDPNVEGRRENGRRIRVLFKFYIRELKRSDMILAFQDR